MKSARASGVAQLFALAIVMSVVVRNQLACAGTSSQSPRLESATTGSNKPPPLAQEPAARDGMSAADSAQRSDPISARLLLPPSQSGYFWIRAAIVDQFGNHIAGLRSSDLHLFEDGKARRVFFIRQSALTISAGIVVDVSETMSSKLHQAATAIAEFARRLDSRDESFLLGFREESFLFQSFTEDHDLLTHKLGHPKTFGLTGMYDAIWKGLLILKHGKNPVRIMLVITDGMDNFSEHDSTEVVALAQELGVVIYAIGIGNSEITISGAGLIGEQDPEHVDAMALAAVAEPTGGRAFTVHKSGDVDALKNACRSISSSAHYAYEIGYLSDDPGSSDSGKLRVRIAKKAWAEIRVRKAAAVESTSTRDASR